MATPREPAATCDPASGTCRVCADEAVPGRVAGVDPASRTATVEFAGHTATVALDLVEARVGDTLLVHLGFAIARLEGP